MIKKLILLYLSILRYPTVKLAIAIAFIILGLSLSVNAAPLRYVNTTGWWLNGSSVFYPSAIPITAAISNSTAGESVYVYNGSYTESLIVTINNFILQGESSNLVNLSGGTPITINTGANYVNVSGFNITTTADYGIESYGNYVNISYNKFRQNGGFAGLYIHGNHGTFSNNTITGVNYGIALDYDIDGMYNVFTDNTVSGSTDAISLYGLGVSNSYSNFTGGSVDSSTGYDYYLLTGCGYVANFQYGAGNDGVYFKNINFTVGTTRRIYLATACILNVTDSGITIRSARWGWSLGADDFNRTIYNLSSTNISFKDNGNSKGYRLSGLLSNTSYYYYKNDVYQSVLTTSSIGDLDYFDNQDVTDAVIKILVAPEATLDSSGVHATSYYISSPTKILKCQGANIYANYSNTSNIVTVTALLQERDGTTTELPMVNIIGGQWAVTYGNDNTTKWGNKTISFRVNTAGGSHISTSDSTVFVYADECSGTNIQTWRNTSYGSGFGNYTKSLFTGEKNLLTFALQPYLNYWGYAIYLLMMFTIMGVIYLKNQSVTQPIIMSFIVVAVLIASNLIPDTYINYVLMFIAAALAAIFWRLFKSS